MPISNTDYLMRTNSFSTEHGARFWNTWYWRCTNGVSTAGNLLAGFVADVMPHIAAIQADYMVGMQIFVQNLDDPEDFTENLNVTFQGTWVTTDPTPSFVTASFTVLRSNLVQRHHGRKAFGGLSEDMISGDQPTVGYVAELDDLADAMEAGIDHSGRQFVLCLPRTVEVENPSPPPATIRNLVELYPRGGVQFGHISTQNSRKSF